MDYRPADPARRVQFDKGVREKIDFRQLEIKLAREVVVFGRWRRERRRRRKTNGTRWDERG